MSSMVYIRSMIIISDVIIHNMSSSMMRCSVVVTVLVVGVNYSSWKGRGSVSGAGTSR